MANQDELISQYIDEAGIKRQTDFFISELQRVIDAADKVGNLNISLSKGKGLSDFRKDITDLQMANDSLVKSTQQVTAAAEAQQKIFSKTGNTVNDLDKATAAAANSATALGKAQQQGSSAAKTMATESEALRKAKEKLATAEAEENIQLQKYSVLSKEANSIAKQEALAALGLVDAYSLLTAEYNAAQRAAKNLSITNPGSSQAKTAAAEALALNTQLQAIDKTVGQSQKNVGNYGSAFGKIFGQIRQLAYILPGIGVAGLFNLAFEGIEKLIDKLKEFASGANNAKEAEEKLKTELAKGNSEYIKAVESVDRLKINIDLAKQGFLSKSDVLKEYNDTLGKSLGQVNNLKDAEQALTDKGDAYILMTLKKSIATLALQDAAKKAYEAELVRLKSVDDFAHPSSGLSASDQDLARGASGAAIRKAEQQKQNQEAAARRQKGIDDKESEGKIFVGIAEKYQKQAAEIAKKYGINPFVGGGSGEKDVEIKAQKKKAFDGILKQEAEDAKKLSEVTSLELASRIREREIAADKEKQIIADVAKTEVANETGKLNATRNKKDVKPNELINAFGEYAAKTKEISQKAAQDIEKIELNSERDIIGIKQSAKVQKLQVDKAYNAETVAALLASDTKKEQVLLDGQTKQIKAATDQKDKEIDAANEIYKFQIERASGNQQKIKEATEQYNRTRLSIEFAYAAKVLQIEINTAKAQIALRKALGEDTLAAEKALNKAQIDLQDVLTKHTKESNAEQNKSNDEKAQKAINALEKIKAIGDEVFKIAGGFINADTVRQKNALQKQSDTIDKQKAKEIDAANATINNAQEKANKIAIIDAKAQAQKDVIAAKQRELDQRQARIDKAQAIFDIVIKTAIAVLNQLKTGDPITAFARAAAVGVIGAAELAVVIATPIPKYKHGTKDKPHPGGPAIVGDGGKHELVTMPSGESWITPNTSTLYNLPKGAQVMPDIDRISDVMLRMVMKPLRAMPTQRQQDSNGAEYLGKKLDTLGQIVKDKHELHISHDAGSFMAMHKYGNSWLKYIEEQTSSFL